MPICIAVGCISDENTKVNERNIVFFPFPEDETIRKQWEENCSFSVKDVRYPRICELHFESSSFLTNNELKANAIPTIFEVSKKRKAGTLSFTKEEIPEDSPSKLIKLDPEPENLETPPQSPSIQLILEADTDKRITEATSFQTQDDPNSIAAKNSIISKQLAMRKLVYRLIIHIDRMHPESSASTENASFRLDSPQKFEYDSEGVIVGDPNYSYTIEQDSSRSKADHQLKNTTSNSKNDSRCTECGNGIDKFGNARVQGNESCHACNAFSIRKSSNSSERRVTCDLCDTEFATQMSYEEHAILHESADPLLPYRCHKCPEIFEIKDDVRQHNRDVHSAVNRNEKDHNVAGETKRSSVQDFYKCEFCYVTFRRAQAYRIHINTHTGQRDLPCDICAKKFRTEKQLNVHKARHGTAVKFTCRICGKQFDSVKEVDEHSRVHTVVKSEFQCNICKKACTNEKMLNDHLRGHLSRAHRCPICPKAFINKTTLGIHLKTHKQATQAKESVLANAKKTYPCTLCAETFASYSDMYSHIMSHLEQMHQDNSSIDVISEVLRTKNENFEASISP